MFETKTFQDFKSHLTGITCLKCSKLTNVLKLTSPKQCRQFSTSLLFGSFLQSGNYLFLRLTSCAWSCKRTDTRDHHLLICCHQAQFSLVWQTFHKSWRRPWEESFFNFSSISWEKKSFPQLQYFFSLHQCQPFVDRPLQSRNGKQSQLGLYFQVSLRSKSDWKL